MEAKIEKRHEWAKGRTAKASALYARGDKFRGDIAFNTQPGHIPERARIIAATDRAFEHSKMAQHHEGRAAGLEHQLETSIFSDDPDAVEQLEAKVAELSAKRDRMKARNAAYRKGLEAFAAFEGCTLEAAAKRRDIIEAGYSWCRRPHPGYELTNLGATIRNAAKRIEEVKRRQTRTAQAEAAGGVSIDRSEASNWCRVTFAEKPEREILNALRAAGYGWGGGSWSGYLDKLPTPVAELVEETERRLDFNLNPAAVESLPLFEER
jgi:hypothetical protein